MATIGCADAEFRDRGAAALAAPRPRAQRHARCVSVRTSIQMIPQKPEQICEKRAALRLPTDRVGYRQTGGAAT
jgi:hypothetical protein